MAVTYEDDRTEAAETPAVIMAIERLCAERQEIEDDLSSYEKKMTQQVQRINADLDRAYQMLRKALEMDVPAERPRPSDPGEYTR
jgi:hypothetical protein